MPDSDGTRWILVAVGSSLRAEEADRPLAYYLKQQLEMALGRLEAADAHLAEAFRVCVVADLRWLKDEEMQRWPTISLGGPGVNLLANKWIEELPLSLGVDDQYYIQMDPDLEEPNVSIWGMNNPATQIAVSAFLQRFGTKYIEHCVRSAPPAPVEPDEDQDDEEEDDED